MQGPIYIYMIVFFQACQRTEVVLFMSFLTPLIAPYSGSHTHPQHKHGPDECFLLPQVDRNVVGFCIFEKYCTLCEVLRTSFTISLVPSQQRRIELTVTK